LTAHVTAGTNYLAADGTTQSVTIGKATPVITFGAAPTPTYPGGNFTVSASTTNTDSSALTYSVVSGPCTFVSGATFSSTGAGTCVVQAAGIATANFTAASQTQSVTIGNPPSVTYRAYLPFIAKSALNAPDLIVQSITATPNNIQIVIKNQGNAAVVDDFWVDVYVNPSPVPTHVNQTWQMLSSQGLVWGVRSPALPLAPNATLTLTMGDAYYFPLLSKFIGNLALGTPVYAQVDSANTNTTYGGVLENHEITGGAYNNISSTAVVAGSAVPKSPRTQDPTRGKLPTR
jgi:hypothetical protein